MQLKDVVEQRKIRRAVEVIKSRIITDIAKND